MTVYDLIAELDSILERYPNSGFWPVVMADGLPVVTVASTVMPNGKTVVYIADREDIGD
jgi:hypothetical protein